jgi:hypothetical protein
MPNMGLIRSIKRKFLLLKLNLILWGKTKIQAEIIVLCHGIKNYRFLNDDDCYSLELDEDRLNIVYGAISHRIQRVWFG